MDKEYHLIGNGRSASLFDQNVLKGVYTCNLPPFAVPQARATFMVDFKMMRAIHEGSVTVPGDWIIGARPKKYTEMFPLFYLKYAPQISEIYTGIPNYAGNYTNFNCGHMGAYYLIERKHAKIIHMYGFDSLFNADLTSCTDFYLGSDRSHENNIRLSNNWRPVWSGIFQEFPDVKFKVYYFKDVPKITFPENVELIVKKP